MQLTDCTLDRMTVRPARLEDAPPIAALHAASWRAFHRGALTDTYLDGVLDQDPSRGALLDNLHVAREYQRLGIGAMLLEASQDFVREHRGVMRMHLWVLQSNERARAFHESVGGKIVGADQWDPPGGGALAPRFRMAWW